MSTQADVAKLIDDAHDSLQKVEGVAVSERNRVEEGIQHARSAVASMVVSTPEPKVEAPAAVVEKPKAPAPVVEPKPAVEAPAPAEAEVADSDAPEAPEAD